MQPNGKGPRWENLGLLLFLSGSFLYYYFTKQAIFNHTNQNPIYKYKFN